MHAFLALAVLLLVRPMLFLRRSAGVLARPSWQRWRSATTAGATNEPNPTSRVSIDRIPTSYTDLLRELYQINMYHPVKLGLQNMERLYDLLERPLDDIPIVHITGTNGKGSVALKVARCLSAKGLRTGLFVSPHIASFRERIQVDASLVSEEEVEAFLPRVMRLCVEHDIPATFFEVTTALAFLCYRHRRCEALVLEVGLGGRLDATNVIPAPVLAIMTSVQLDHQKILGATRELIAREKAGIFKRGSAVLLGPETPQAVVVPQARAAGASPIVSLTDMACVLGERTGAALFDASRAAQPPTFGYADTDHLNSDLARAALHLLQHPTLADDAALRAKQELLARRLAHSAVSSVALVRDEPLRLALRARPPCRFEQFALVSLGVPDRGAPQGLRAVPCRDVRVVLDIAHNIEAMGALVRRLRVFFPHSPLRVVLGMSADKDVDQCVALVRQLAPPARVYCTQAEHPRALSSASLRRLLDAGSAADGRRNDGTVREALARALLDAAAPSDASAADATDAVAAVRPLDAASDAGAAEEAAPPALVVVCGTAFIMAEARAALGLREPRDAVHFHATYSFSPPGGGAAAWRDLQEHFAGPSGAGGSDAPPPSAAR